MQNESKQIYKANVAEMQQTRDLKVSSSMLTCGHSLAKAL